MTPALRFPLPRKALLALAVLTAITGHSFGQNVGTFLLGKIQNFDQITSAAPTLNSTQPFQFGSLISMGTATINSATLTFSGTASPRAYTAAGAGDFSILDTFTSQAQLDAAYPTTTYNLSVNTSVGVLAKSISYIPIFTYPSTTPRLTVPAADWQNGMLTVNPAADYTLTWTAYSGGGVTDAIQLFIRNSTINLSPFAATVTSYTIPAGSLQPGTNYQCDLAFLRAAGATTADTNFGAGYATFVKDTGFIIHTTTPPLVLSSAVSRKDHAGTTFDLPLPLTGDSGVESRSGGATGDHTLIFTFSNPVTAGSAAVTSGIGSVASTAFNGSTMTVNLTGVADIQNVTLTLTGVTDTFAQVLPPTVAPVSFLIGDVNGDRIVNSGDVLQTRSRSGQPLAAANFHSDVNTDGILNSGDTLIVRARSGNSLP